MNLLTLLPKASMPSSSDRWNKHLSTNVWSAMMINWAGIKLRMCTMKASSGKGFARLMLLNSRNKATPLYLVILLRATELTV